MPLDKRKSERSNFRSIEVPKKLQARRPISALLRSLPPPKLHPYLSSSLTKSTKASDVDTNSNIYSSVDDSKVKTSTNKVGRPKKNMTLKEVRLVEIPFAGN